MLCEDGTTADLKNAVALPEPPAISALLRPLAEYEAVAGGSF